MIEISGLKDEKKEIKTGQKWGMTNCLANYELENFEFLLGVTIWYDILFAVNLVRTYNQKICALMKLLNN